MRITTTQSVHTQFILSKNLFKADGVFESISVHFQINLAERNQVNELFKPEANQALDVPELGGK